MKAVYKLHPRLHGWISEENGLRKRFTLIDCENTLSFRILRDLNALFVAADSYNGSVSATKKEMKAPHLRRPVL